MHKNTGNGYLATWIVMVIRSRKQNQLGIIMRNKIFSLLGLILAVLLLTGCEALESGRRAHFKSIQDVRPDEAIAVGRITIKAFKKDSPIPNNGRNCILVVYNGSKHYQTHIPTDGLVCLRLPAGENNIQMLAIGDYPLVAYGFPIGEVTINLKEPGHAYYIGDLLAESQEAPNSSLWRRKYDLMLTVQANQSQTQEEYRKQYPDCPRELIPSQVKLSESPVRAHWEE